MRLWHSISAVVAGLAIVSPGLRAETPLREVPVGVEPDEQKYIDSVLAKRAEVMEQRKKLYDDYAKKVEDLKAEHQKRAQLGSATVTIDEETKQVAEPATIEAALDTKQPVRDAYEVSPDDFKIYEHDRWSINISDFHFDRPQYIVAKTKEGAARRWFTFTYTVTNSTPKKRRIAPQFVAVTNKGAINLSAGGFVPERLLADTLGRPLVYSTQLHDKDLMAQRVKPLESTLYVGDYSLDLDKGAVELSPLATFEPGQTRWGAAVWPEFSDEFTELKIVVHGLSNAHRYDEKMRRVLVLTFTRNDDEFNVHRSELKFQDKRWEYLWMWDQSINVPLPTDAKDPQIKAQTIKTPAGADKLVWGFPFVVNNPTRKNQDFAINSVSFVCPVEVDVGGTKVPVEVKVVDDGRSTIYKAQHLKSLTKESPKDRYELNKGNTEGSKTQLQRRSTTIEVGKALDELWAVFDEADVDWADVQMQVESVLTEKADKKALAKQTWEQLVKTAAPDKQDLLQKDPGFLYEPHRHLTDDELKAVREQVTKALPGAIDAAKAKKNVTAYFDCTSGLSTGKYRISRSYRQPGVVQEEWLKAWEELDKAPAQ